MMPSWANPLDWDAWTKAVLGLGAVAGGIWRHGRAISSWWHHRREAERSARKATRVLLETVDLKNEELALKDRIIAELEAHSARKDAIITRQDERIASLEARLDEGRS